VRDGQWAAHSRRVTQPGRPEHPEDEEPHDIVTPTEREALERSIAARRRRYFLVMVPCIALVLFGFFVPAPTPLRVAALAVAAVLPPVASILGNS
jgi:hypothetical protein